MSTSPEIIPVDGAGSGGQPAPAPRAAPVYKAPVAVQPAPAAPLPTQGITVMNSDGSFYSSDLGPQGPGAYAPEIDQDGMNPLIEMMLVSRLFSKNKKKSRAKAQQPQIIVVQVPTGSLPVEGAAPDIRDPGLVGSYTNVTKTKLKK